MREAGLQEIHPNSYQMWLNKGELLAVMHVFSLNHLVVDSDWIKEILKNDGICLPFSKSLPWYTWIGDAQTYSNFLFWKDIFIYNLANSKLKIFVNIQVVAGRKICKDVL